MRAFVAAVVALTLAGCGSLPRNAVPGDLAPQATVPGYPDVRAWAGQPSDPLMRARRVVAQSVAERRFRRGRTVRCATRTSRCRAAAPTARSAPGS